MITRKSSEKWALFSLFDVAIIVIGGDLILAFILSQSPALMSEPAVILANYLWAALPFFAVYHYVRRGGFQSHVLLACLSGEALTFAGWLYYYRQAFLAQTGQLSGGADIGLGFIMMALPLIVLGAMAVIITATKGKMPDDEIL